MTDEISIAELKQRLRSYRQDAKRYRLLRRDRVYCMFSDDTVVYEAMEKLDAALDARLKEEPDVD